jgi:hypothetical protein
MTTWVAPRRALAVDVEIVEAVEAAVGLEPLVGVGDDRRVEQPDVADGLGVVDEVLALSSSSYSKVCVSTSPRFIAAGGLDVVPDVGGAPWWTRPAALRKRWMKVG